MATTNFVRAWKDGERQFVNINGATVEVTSCIWDDGMVTLQFRARVAPSELVGDEEQAACRIDSRLAGRSAN